MVEPVWLPTPEVSPTEYPAALYTPLVVKLIRRLEPHSPNASAHLPTQDRTYEHPAGSNRTYHNLGDMNVKAITTRIIILRLIANDGLRMVEVGLALGLGMALAGSRMLKRCCSRSARMTH